jgi:hypothetical protein
MTSLIARIVRTGATPPARGGPPDNRRAEVLAGAVAQLNQRTSLWLPADVCDSTAGPRRETYSRHGPLLLKRQKYNHCVSP